MDDRLMLRDGLSIISSCRSRIGDIWHAHIGAAAIACVFTVKENRLSDEVTNSMMEQAALMVDKQRLTEKIETLPMRSRLLLSR
ncbi:hypothetical protein [Cohnella luojiensis]|uniref:Uncharacterized protein n=1 Tax=Cohnella luojiensis TaxID=652876 RepID=A0A4Y8LT35_9BACL|nr:hypothetical protein [Cohnella luojiensis]TFE22592.1 hypothetical protein E2980_21640 [Cohnella luojiensis]